MKRHFISYPKSGRTWIRYALVRMGAAKGILFHHDGFEFNDGAKPPHDFQVERRLTAYHSVDRILYLERDPRDVMCSLYHQVTGRFSDFFGYTGSISDFLRDPYFGAENLHRFRLMWSEIARRRDVYCVTYEEMTREPAATLSRIVEYLELNITPEAVENAARESEISRMRQVELSGEFNADWLKLRNGHPKVRAGKVHGFRDELSADDINYLNTVFCL